MKRFAALSLLSFIALAPVIRSQPAKTIGPLVSQNAVAVVRVNLAAVNPGEQIKFLRKHIGDIRPVQQMAKQLTQFIGPLKEAGAKELYVVAYASNRTRQGWAFAVPVSKGVKSERINTFFRNMRAPVLTRLGGMIVAGGNNIAEIAKTPAGKNPALQAAFKAVAGADVQAVVFLGEPSRLAIVQGTPEKLPDGTSPAALVNAFRWAAVGVKLKPKISARAVVQAGDAKAAMLLHRFVKKAIASETQPSAQWYGILADLYKAVAPKVVRNQITARVEERQVTAFLRNAAKSVQKAEKRFTSVNNLKQMGLALHNHQDTFRKLPAVANFDQQGRPLLSWRVHILPFIEQQQLYRQFRLNEPWNSPHNKKLIAKMPKEYRSPASKAKPGMTTYLAVVGKGTIFGKTPNSLNRIAASDGTSNTAWIVEAADSHAVPWTKPADLPLDLKNPHGGLGNNGQNAFHAAIADGSVRAIPLATSAEMLRRLFQYNDGKVVNLP